METGRDGDSNNNMYSASKEHCWDDISMKVSGKDYCEAMAGRERRTARRRIKNKLPKRDTPAPPSPAAPMATGTVAVVTALVDAPSAPALADGGQGAEMKSGQGAEMCVEHLQRL